MAPFEIVLQAVIAVVSLVVLALVVNEVAARPAAAPEPVEHPTVPIPTGRRSR